MLSRSAGIKKEVDRNYSNPHRGGKTGKLNSFVRLCYYSLDYIIGYFVKVKSVTRITRVVVFDRYYTDIICDSRRSRIYLGPKFLYWWGKLFIPTLDYNILLTASSETILARKRELDEEGIKTINAKIDYLADKKGAFRVHGGGFAGTMQAFVPHDRMNAFRETMESVFGKGAVTELSVRPLGACAVYHG